MGKAEWVDWYIPADFYQKAWSTAKRYAKKHPNADRDIIYTASTEAAELYERSEALRSRFKFHVWCWLRIRTALYITERKKKMLGKRLTDEQKAEIVQLRKEGLTRKEIAEKTGVGTSSVDRVLRKEKESPAEPAEKAGKSVQKETPETAEAAESGTDKKFDAFIIPPKTENVKPPEAGAFSLMKQLAAAMRSERITELCAAFECGGERYRLELRKVET